ncbi:hypothetical protein I4U23_005535 [Adineta vaga]|nr:hypothetical protein I4U23_005535 [Adineta vaga]
MSGQLLTFVDKNNEARCACLLIASSSKTLPLIVWLQPSFVYPTSVYSTNFIKEALTVNLMNTTNSSSIGYHLLLPAARITKNFECGIINCIAWDTWYRNFNRSDPNMNVDIQTIDYFINHIIYNIASMALLYALNTPNIAATAVYSSTNPYQNNNDPCPQIPYPLQRTSILDVVNECDYSGICQGGEAFINDLNNRYKNQLVARFITINGYSKPQATSTPNVCIFGITKGAISQHLRYNVAIGILAGLASLAVITILRAVFILPAIYGYRSAKLVSLEESLQPIQLHIHQLPFYVQTAKKRCHFPSEHGLTCDESASIYIYTMEWGETSLYRVLNKVLRDENRDALTIYQLFEKIYHVIKDFLGNETNSTIFLIETSSGKKISDYTDQEQEDEVILTMGTDFHVQGNVLEHRKGSFHVHLVEINDEKE